MRLALAVLLLVGCSKAAEKTPAPPATRHYTFKAIAGVSMGAIGSSRLVVQQPEKFDAQASLGGPLDAAMLSAMLERAFLGGFCSADQLNAAVAADANDGGNRMDRQGGACTQTNPAPLTHYSRSQRFDDWAFTTNGGTFDRDMHLDIFRDLTLAIGNPLAHAANWSSATCANPIVVKNIIDAIYSPHGEHDAITFCDGQPPVMLCADGALVDWCAAAALNGRALAQSSDADSFCASHGGNARSAGKDDDAFYANEGALPGCWPGSRVVPFALAIDLNGNGRRDYHEPIVLQMHEPFSDVGADGCDDAHEDGKGGCTDAAHSPYASGTKDPNGDDYDAVTNPNGTEGDLRWEPGEPFQDVGLDGVAGTGDFGEGDGKFTVAPALQHWFDGDLRTNLGSVRGVDLYEEGGIRDVFDLGAMAEAVAGGLRSRASFTAFSDFPQIPGNWSSGFDPIFMDPSVLGSSMLMNYGTPNASPAQIRAGDGDHVGTTVQALYRFEVFFRWLSQRWTPAIPTPPIASGNGRQDLHSVNFVSLGGAAQDFVVSVPPGYDDPANAGARYPVFLMLHGYGQDAEDMASGVGPATDALSKIGKMMPMIGVYPSGRCCLTGPNGERTCDESSVDWEAQGYVRECQRGSFYLDRVGESATDQTRYGAAVFELLDWVDAQYRTLPPADAPAH